MKKLIAKRPVLYLGRTYQAGDALPANDECMVAAWLRAKTAAWSDQEAAQATETADSTEDTKGKETAENASQEAVEGHLDAAQLEEMSKAELEKLAADMGVDIPKGAAKALIIEKLAAVTVQAPAEAAEE